MTIAIVSTAGASNANAYEEVAYIDSYAATTAWAASWALVGAGDPKAVLAIRAARAIDILALAGYPTSDTQALQFPRTGVYTPRGTELNPDTIPDAVKRAWAHTAAYLSSFATTADPFSVDDTGKLASLTVGPIALAFRQSVGPDGATFLSSVIAPMLRPFGLVGPSGAVRLVR